MSQLQDKEIYSDFDWTMPQTEGAASLRTVGTEKDGEPGTAREPGTFARVNAEGGWRQASPAQNPEEPATVGYEMARPRPASEIFGFRERPYDMRWGVPKQVLKEFGISVNVLKSAWASGWVRARQGNWENEDKRTQTIYCFEDIHGFVERVMHRVSEQYAEKWWTDDNIQALSEKLPDGPYRRRVATGGSKLRKDGFERLPRKV